MRLLVGALVIVLLAGCGQSIAEQQANRTSATCAIAGGGSHEGKR